MPQTGFTTQAAAPAAGRGTAPGRPDDAAGPIIELSGVSYRYPGQTRDAVSRLDLSLAAGQALGLVGESGSGKSTALAVMAGLIRDLRHGRVQFEGAPLALRSPARRRYFRRRVQVVFQDPYNSLDPRQRIGAALAEPLIALGLEPSREGRRDRCAAMLAAVGLEPAMAERWPHEFSGGQRQRVAIARALLTEPRVLLADEPVSALDQATKVELVDLLRTIAAQRGLALVMVSHDLAVVAELCSHLIVMARGQVVEAGATGQVLGHPGQTYTRDLIAAVPRLPVGNG
jgi:peptide/nickel transport system ATP-binding protein